MADRGERCLEVALALCRDTDRARGIGDHAGGEALLLARDRHRYDAARKPSEILQETLAILGGQHADHEHQRARDPLLEIGERIGDRAGAIRIMAAVEPKLAARRA